MVDGTFFNTVLIWDINDVETGPCTFDYVVQEDSIKLDVSFIQNDLSNELLVSSIRPDNLPSYFLSKQSAYFNVTFQGLDTDFFKTQYTPFLKGNVRFGLIFNPPELLSSDFKNIEFDDFYMNLDVNSDTIELKGDMQFIDGKLNLSDDFVSNGEVDVLLLFSHYFNHNQ